MEKSFRAILNEHLEDVNAAPRAAPRNQPLAFEPFFLPPKLNARVNPERAFHRGYVREEKLSRERAELARRPRPEPIISMDRLSPADRADLARLVELGGLELADGLSPARLKAAFRRLARRHHPDANAGAGHETFLDLHARYARLRGRLASLQT